MKLYYAPGACSLAGHISLHEAAIDVELVKVDLKTKQTEDGEDYKLLNPKGYVPALVLDGGQILTENVAVLAWISQHGRLAEPVGELGSYRLLEMLAFISTELHKAFKPFFSPEASDEEKSRAGNAIAGRLTYLAQRWQGDYLFGPEFSVADAYLFVMLLWAEKNGLAAPGPLRDFGERMKQRPAVQLALRHEGLA
jgi:Glutathione S-transferase